MIKRYFATKDNTITNAFQENLVTRGTGSNMGQADILEVFTIYGQVSNSSGLASEKSRVLIQFNASQILSDKNNSIIASGSSFYLKCFNAKHSQTLPRDYTLEVVNLEQSWEEGLGLDMEGYTDLTYNTRGSNWVKRQGGNIKEITKFTFKSATVTDYGAGSGANWVKLYNGTSVYGAIWFNDGGGDTEPLEENPIQVSIVGDTTTVEIATAFQLAVDGNANFTANRIGSSVYVTASLAGPPFATVSLVGALDPDDLTPEVWYAGDSSWRTAGATSGSYLASATFPVGDEDLEVDITTLVNSWIDGSYENNGVMIRLSSSLEDSSRSYYTKKFFARSTEYHFSKPVLEARWDSSVRDDRGNFYLSSSLAPAADNLNTIYLYNYVRGRLTNIPSIDTDNREIMVSLFSGSSSNTAASGSALILSVDGTNVVTGNPYVVTGGLVSTGIYSASFAYTGSSTIETVYDVWFSGSDSVREATGSSLQFNTGSVEVKRFTALQNTDTSKYVLSVSNRNNTYNKDQTHRIRMYARQKRWSPNIYPTATTVPNSLIFASASYQVYRVVDDRVVIPYNTGSINGTRLSYDVSGNYFDLDTSMLEENYTYGVRISVYDPDTLTYEEQPFTYKLRVTKNEY